MSRFKFVSAEMEASFEKLLNAKKKMNKIKRKSLWLKKFLAIKNKKKKWVGPEKVKQCFLKQDISWSTFIGFV